MNVIKYKKAKRKDLNNLLNLRMEVLKEVFTPIEENITSSMWESITRNNYSIFKEGFKKNKIISYLAYNKKNIIGCGSVCFSVELPSPDNVNGQGAYIMNIYTKKEYRKRGVATNICRHLIEEAKKEGAKKIFLETSIDGKKLYQNLGFTNMKDYMKLGLLFSEEIMRKEGKLDE